ncbi:uncharacterized protein PAC_10524 [Phialocephala subalpina]|uniref:Heterokaryon incompatibility domain-containing protein n=1 Tax=Phialocephala subalpina TaxID=576137 RepID=A0A1L7X6I8_9HELO|nr:uncharacterized protein PAC_10524 [Phialocephala subalpina]
MEAASPVLGFSIFQASSKLLLDTFLAKIFYHLRWVLVLHFFCLPQVLFIANSNWQWAWLLVGSLGAGSLRSLITGKGSWQKEKKKAIDQFITTTLWLAMIMPIHRADSPFLVPSLVRLSNPTLKWLLFHHLFCGLLLYQYLGPRWLLSSLGTCQRIMNWILWTIKPFVNSVFAAMLDELSLRCTQILVLASNIIASIFLGHLYMYVIWSIWAAYLYLQGYTFLQICSTIPPNFFHWPYNLSKLVCALLSIYVSLKKSEDIPKDSRTQNTTPQLNPYEYQELGEKHIRLLLVHPRHRTGRIRCSMFQVPLAKAPRFEAISYCWGKDAKREVKIDVNGCSVLVTPNAEEVLKSKSGYWLPKLVWIDGICIDQDNIQDRSAQVNVMGEIYQKAHLVSVILVQKSDIHAIKEHFVEIGRRYPRVHTVLDRAYFAALGPEEEKYVSQYIFSHYVSDVLEDLYYSSFSHPGAGMAMFRKLAPQSRQLRFESFREFLRNPWFNRMWVIQEVGLARKVRIQYGQMDINFDHLLGALELFQKYPELLPLLQRSTDLTAWRSPPGGAIQVNAMQTIRSKVENRESRSLTDILFLCRNSQSGDPRDRLYALKHLLSSDVIDHLKKLDEDILHADYSDLTTASKVYIKMARCIIHEGNAARMLSICGSGHVQSGEESSGITLPSWVPDWTQDSLAADLFYTKSEKKYTAGGVGPMDVELKEDGGERIGELGTSDAHLSLLVQGIIFDVIAELAEPLLAFPSEDLSQFGALVRSQAMVFVNTFDTIMKSTFLASQEDYPHVKPKPQKLRETFWRTAMGNRTLEKILPDPPTETEDTDISQQGVKNWMKEFTMFKKEVNHLEDCFEKYEAFSRLVASGQAEVLSDPGREVPWELITKFSQVKDFVGPAGQCWAGRRFCVTEQGYVGVVPSLCEEGDKIVVFPGMQTPLCLRATERVGRWRIVGGCYVHGIMNGEALQAGLEKLEFEII